MKKLALIFLSFLFLGSCIQTDFESEVEPILRISLTSEPLRETAVFTFKAQYINTIAQEEDVFVIWESKNPDIISIDNMGNALAVKEGIGTILVSFGGLSDSTIVEVLPSREALIISNFINTLQVGDSFQFEALYMDLEGIVTMPESETWRSSEPSILSVDNQGNVNALTPGTAEISVMVGDLSSSQVVESTAQIVVVPEEIRITDFTTSIDLHNSYTFVAQFFDTSGQPDPSAIISWSSSDDNIISIDENGVATANNSGMATIVASSGTKQAGIEVEVISTEILQRTATLSGVGGYNISGTGALEVDGDGNLILNLNGITVDGPGPYFYLSNSSSSINNGINLGKSSNGNFSFNITNIDPNAAIDSYDYIVVWCQPFRTTLGFGQLNN